jgi:3-phosphoshikimate 1-carboxyvinyltransferase
MPAPDEIAIQPLDAPIDADVRVPGSKSYTNRALVLAGLAAGRSTLEGALFSDDTRYMAEALRQLGIEVDADEATARFSVQGCDGVIPATEASVFIGNSGTTARFLPVMMALGHGRYELDGVERMHQRPIHPLIDALQSLGARVECLGEPGCVPLRVMADGLRGGTVTVPGHLSSQYITGLLLSAPYMQQGLSLRVEGKLVSRPYLEITRQAMDAFGVRVEHPDPASFRVAPGQRYRGRSYRVEPDASGASYFFAAAAICGGRVRVEGLGRGSLQGDLGLVQILEQMGCRLEQTDDATELRGPEDGVLRGVVVDMADLSDVAQTLAVVAPFANGPTRITGIGFIRRKETDRVGAVVRELSRLGIRAEEEDDGMVIHPGTPQPGAVETYDDHRMAMSFALLGLRVPGIRILDPACTAKTFPTFWDVLETLHA